MARSGDRVMRRPTLTAGRDLGECEGSVRNDDLPSESARHRSVSSARERIGDQTPSARRPSTMSRAGSAENRDATAVLPAAFERQALINALARARRERGITQAEIARRMNTKQPSISRFESGTLDSSHSFEDRYALAIGLRIIRTLEPGWPRLTTSFGDADVGSSGRSLKAGSRVSYVPDTGVTGGRETERPPRHPRVVGLADR